MKLSVMKLVAAVALSITCAGIGAAWAQSKDPSDDPANSAGARAAAGAPRPGARYQYMCETNWNVRMYDPEVIAKLNDLGKQGWHLLTPMIMRAPRTPYADVYCFERAY